MSADIELQKAIRARLVDAAAGVVPAAHILDVSQRPAPNPSIILGDSQIVDEGTSLRRAHWRVYHTLHVWKREGSLEGVKAISGLILSALHGGRLVLSGPYHCADLRVSSMRYLRDPGGEMSLAVVTVEALIVDKLAAPDLWIIGADDIIAADTPILGWPA